ncbi:DNA-invertase hin [bacterium MnTg02]|nr:DNA-invertase hin [bacterium MnTg02]
MGRKIGYARVSSVDQDLSIQKAALTADACDIVFEEKITGTKRAGREQLDLALKVLSKGDTLVVTRLDRLGRSLRDLANLAHEIEAKGAALRVLEQSVDTSTSAGKAFFGMLAVFAQFETDVRRERQAEGILKIMADPKKRREKYPGGKPRIDRKQILNLRAKGFGPSAIANEMGISRMSVYRVLGEAESDAPR